MTETRTGTTSGADEKNGGAAKLSTVATVVAVVVLVGYLVVVYALWQRIPGTPETEWLRMTDLRGGLEALAFAAAGALFGTTVQRQATKQAEKNADQERARADEKTMQAEGGIRLAGAIRGARAAAPSGATTMSADEASGSLARLDDIARQYGL
jgi:hypothetical protein